MGLTAVVVAQEHSSSLSTQDITTGVVVAHEHSSSVSTQDLATFEVATGA